MKGVWTNNVVTGFVDNTQQRQNEMKTKNAIEIANQRDANSKAAFQSGLNATTQEVKNNYNSMCNNELLANAIVLAAQSHGVNDYDNLESSTAIIDRFLRKNPNKGYEKYVNDCMQGKITLGEAVTNMRLDRVSTPASTNNGETKTSRINPLKMDTTSYGAGSSVGGVDNTALTLGLGTSIGVPLAAETFYGGGKLAGRVGKSWMGQIYKPTDTQKSYKQYLDAKIIQAQDKVKDAKKGLKLSEKNLKNATKRGTVTEELRLGVENAKEALKKAEGMLSSAQESKKTLRTVADTAYEYGIGDIRNGSIFNDKGGAVARARANEIFDDVLNPIFMADDAATINVMNRVEELKDIIPNLTNDPGRQEDLMDAWAAMVDEYRGKGFDEYPLKDVQKLKSDLQKDVPEKLWKGKNISSAYKELKAELSRLIREDLITELDNALSSGKFPSLEGTRYAGKDAATLYRDWANLDEIADRALMYKVPGVNIPYVGRIEGDIAGPTQKTFATTLRKYGDAVNDSKFGRAMEKINSSIGNLFKNSKVLKVIGGLGAVLGSIGWGADAVEVTSSENALKWLDDLIKIRERYLRLGEFSGKTDEEIETIYPESEVIKTLQNIDADEGFNNWYDTYGKDLLGREKIDIDDYWDYVGGRLKDTGQGLPEDEYWNLRKNNADPIIDMSPEGEIKRNINNLKNK